MTSWFRFDRREAKINTAHNIHENIEIKQTGGVAQFMCKELSQYAKESEPDFRGLGRWCFLDDLCPPFSQNTYSFCLHLGPSTSNYLGTVYQQHLRYIQQNNLNTTPHRLFMIDFLASVINWRKAGERLIIMADMNEHVLKGQLARRLLESRITRGNKHTLGKQGTKHPHQRFQTNRRDILFSRIGNHRHIATILPWERRGPQICHLRHHC